MRKLGLIIRREYLTRIRRRSFVLATLLTPLAFGLFVVLINYILRYESDDQLRIAVIDQGDLFRGAIADERNLYFRLVDADPDSLRRNFADSGFDGILLVRPAGDLYRQNYTAVYYSDKKLTLDVEPVLLDRLSTALRRYKIEQLQLDQRALDALDSRVEISPRPIQSSRDEGSPLAGRIAALIGIAMGFVMYVTVFVYGMMVMRGVMEEKSNRIIEVIIATVRPFPLMLGKIIGVGAVGLTQVAAWAVLVPVILLSLNLLFGFSAPPAEMSDLPPEFADLDTSQVAQQITTELKKLNWPLIVPLFLLYFLGGYFMYAALFAAVGSAMDDDMGESQSLTIPITIPVVLAFYIMVAAIQSPNSTLAVGASYFPLFSPIVMPARLPFEPPWWEIALSLALLLGAAVGLVWLAGRIYRIGILTYGKKVGLRDLGRWLFRRD